MTEDDEKLVLTACVRHSQSVTKPLVAVQKWNYYLQQAQERPVLIIMAALFLRSTRVIF